MNKVSVIADYSAYQPVYRFWTKVDRPVLLYTELLEWLEINCTKRVVIGHTWIYCENEADAVFFKLSHNLTIYRL